MQCSTRTAAAHASCHYLTEHEEHSLVQLFTVLGNMGYGLVHDDLHSFADSIVNENIDKCEHVLISKHVTEGMLTRHKDLIKLLQQLLWIQREPNKLQLICGMQYFANWILM